MATQLEPEARDSADVFREEVRQFIAENFPEELKGKGLSMAGAEGGAK